MSASTRQLTSRCLFKWDANWGLNKDGKLWALAGNKIVTATFDRGGTAGAASAVDVNGRVYVPGYKTPRAHYISGVRTTLLEGSRVNLCLNSEAMSGGAWSPVGTPTITNAYATAAGLSFSRNQVTPGTNYTTQTITFTADATKSFRFFAKQSNGASGTLTVDLRQSGVATRVSVDLTITAGGVISAVATTGTLLQTVALADGVYGFLVQAPSVVAAGTNVIRAGIAGTCTDILLTGWQAENAAFPSSYIPTTTGAVTRAADALSFPFSPVPQAMTVYCKTYDGGANGGSLTAGLFNIGKSDGSTNPLFQLYGTSGKYRAYHHNGSASVISAAAASTAMGDLVETRSVLYADGSVALGQTINSGTEAVAATSAANTLSSAWSTPTVLIVGAYDLASSQGFAAFQSLKIAAGVQTLATMRAL